MSTRQLGAVTKCRKGYDVLSPPFRYPALAFYFLPLAPSAQSEDVFALCSIDAATEGMAPPDEDAENDTNAVPAPRQEAPSDAPGEANLLVNIG